MFIIMDLLNVILVIYQINDESKKRYDKIKTY